MMIDCGELHCSTGAQAPSLVSGLALQARPTRERCRGRRELLHGVTC